MYLGQGCSVASSLEVLRVSNITVLHFPTEGVNDAQNVSLDRARGKDNERQNLLQNDNVILQGI